MNDQRLDMAACAGAVLRDDPGPGSTLLRLAASAPGIADEANNGDGTIDQSKVTDGELLSITQANFPTVAHLYFDSEGAPVGKLEITEEEGSQ